MGLNFENCNIRFPSNYWNAILPFKYLYEFSVMYYLLSFQPSILQNYYQVPHFVNLLSSTLYRHVLITGVMN